MVTIDFYRYVPTLRVSSIQNKNIFTSIFDHSIDKFGNQLDLARARLLASIWLKEHYGKVIINIDDELGMTEIRMCNKQKMTRELGNLGVKIKLTRGK